MIRVAQCAPNDPEIRTPGIRKTRRCLATSPGLRLVSEANRKDARTVDELVQLVPNEGRTLGWEVDQAWKVPETVAGFRSLFRSSIAPLTLSIYRMNQEVPGRTGGNFEKRFRRRARDAGRTKMAGQLKLAGGGQPAGPPWRCGAESPNPEPQAVRRAGHAACR